MSAATQYFIVGFQIPCVANAPVPFTIRAVDGTGALDTTYNGTAQITSSDPIAELLHYGTLPVDLTFASGIATGVMVFHTAGAQTIAAQDTTTPSIAGSASTTVTTQQGWGQDSYGLSPYGSTAAGTGINITGATAVTTHDVQVSLSGRPKAITPASPGDALNPNTWVVQRLDTATYLHVVTVTAVAPTVYQLTCLEAFGDATVTHRASSTTLLDANGNPLIAPRSANFIGLVDAGLKDNAATATTAGAFSVDVANPQLPVANVTVGGTLVVTAAGDYANESGAVLVKKKLLRRFFTKRGRFFHLPNYGEGLDEKVLPTDLVRKRADLEAAALAEPEVQQCTVGLSLSAAGVLTLSVNAVLRSGGGLQFSTPVNDSVG